MREPGRRRVVMGAVALATAGWAAAAPAAVPISRGEQFLPVSENDCMGRAQRAFGAEGWSSITMGGRYVSAFKGIHSAYITCNAVRDGQAVVVNVFVASERGDGNIPGAERERLQRQMAAGLPTESSGPGALVQEPPPPPAPPPLVEAPPSATPATSSPPRVAGSPRAVFLGQTGEDLVGPGNQLTANGVRDLHVRIDNLPAMPTAYTVLGEGTARWAWPYNGAQWVVVGRPSGTTLDLFFEPYPSTKFRVVLTFADGRVLDIPVQ
jgi:hypothetical protein